MKTGNVGIKVQSKAEEIEVLIRHFEAGCGVGDAVKLTTLLIQYFRADIDPAEGQLSIFHAEQSGET